MDKPIISILCISFNHEKYIREALNSFVTQQTEYPFEIVVHDDCSTDGTREILSEYALNYPDKFVLVLQSENQHSQGKNVLELRHAACRGKYVALCEGDDYWTDTHKIQLQCEFLESNPNYSMVFNNSIVVEDSVQRNRLFCDLDRSSFALRDIILKDWFIPTQSIMYRRSAMEFQPWFAYAHSLDYCMQLMLASVGDIYYIDRVMSAYRVHALGISQNIPAGFPQMKKIQILSHFDLLTNFKYHALIESRCGIERRWLYRKTVDARPLHVRLFSIDYYINKARNRIPFLRRWLGD